jgi:hypothetical protein
MINTGEQLAKLILEQLGGNKFAFMTGAKHFAYANNCLTFRIGRNSKRVNCVRVTLNGLALYDMEFFTVGKRGAKVLSSAENLYADQLTTAFTLGTGLYTHL